MSDEELSQQIEISKREGVGRGGKWHAVLRSRDTVCDEVSAADGAVDVSRSQWVGWERFDRIVKTGEFCRVCESRLVEAGVVTPRWFTRE